MSQSPPDILSEAWAWDNFRTDVFQLLGWGYRLAEQEVRRRRQEVEITGLLRDSINKKLDEDLPARFWYYSAKNEDPVDDDGTFGNKRPRVDILIEYGVPPRKRYRLEAKRCAAGLTRTHKVKEAIDWYAQGITAFLEGHYAKDAPEAGLLGLVQSDNPAFWKARLSEKLDQDTLLSCRTSLKDAPLTSDLPETSVSEHQRNDGTALTLYHAFLDCTS